MEKFQQITEFIKGLYNTRDFIPLHEPRFVSNEKKYLNDCIDSTFVSSVGKFVDQFEQMVCSFTGSKYAIATSNGTSALHIALILAGVSADDEVLCPALTFVATPNAISYCNAKPIFIDSAVDNLGMCPESIADFLSANGEVRSDGYCYNKTSGRRITACVPMHTFGHPVKIAEIIRVCSDYNIEVIEDAAESLGSFVGDQHTGTFAKVAALSFNGNKTITCGGGGVVLIQDEALAKRAKHLTTTAKVPHKWEFNHDEVGYNYRLPNLNAALACAQMEFLPRALESKREVAEQYASFFNALGIKFISEPEGTKSNYWLNAIEFTSKEERDLFLDFSNSNGVMTRPTWTLMNKLPAFATCQKTKLQNAERYERLVVNIPSSVRV